MVGELAILRIYLNESDRYKGDSFYHFIINTAKDMGIKGGTVYRGIEGFGKHQAIHSSKLEVLAHNLPIVVELIDENEKIRKLGQKIKAFEKEAFIIMIPNVEMI